MTTPVFPDKRQVNVYLPLDDDVFLNEVKQHTKVNKSDFMHLMIAYFQANMSMQDITELADTMRLKGALT